MVPVASYFKFTQHNDMTVDWYIGKRCNYSCSYCANFLHDSFSPHIPLEDMKKFVDILYKNHNKNIIWSLTGGEPTLHPQFIELCKYIKQKKSKHISLTTNGSRTLEYFKELFQYIDNITVSFHFEFMSNDIDKFAKRFISLEKYIQKWNTKQKKNKNFPDWNNGYVEKTLILRFMVEPSQLKNIKKMESIFKLNNIKNLEYRYVRKFSEDNYKPTNILKKKLLYYPTKTNCTEYNLPEYNQKNTPLNDSTNLYSENEIIEIKQLYNKSNDNGKKLKIWFYDNKYKYRDRDYHYNELNFNKQNNFSGWLCWAGSKHIKVDPHGNIFIGSCHVGGLRGNIYDTNNIDLPNKPIQCTKKRCNDNLDLRVPKIKNWKYYHLVKLII